MLIDHLIASPETIRRPPADGKMFDYMLAGNGVFKRARRDGLAAQIPVVQMPGAIEALPALKTAVALPARVPGRFLLVMLDAAKVAMPSEMLFSLTYRGAWRLYIPPQDVNEASARPADPHDVEFGRAVIELHSHHHNPAFFSRQDDREETGFRIYAVIGRIDTAFPEINVRVGIYGQRAAIPARLVFDGPGSFIDVNER